MKVYDWTVEIRKTDNYVYPKHFRSAWDDFTMCIPAWKSYLTKRYKGKDNLQFLELGTAQGRATVWLLEEILTGKNCNIITVDANIEQSAKVTGNSLINKAFEQIEDELKYKNENLSEFSKVTSQKDWWDNRENVEIVYNVVNNLAPYIEKKSCTFYNLKTSEFFNQFTSNEPIFDFVYIDASHSPEDVIFDAINSFRYLKTGGMMIFDDYWWGKCKVGIDCFIETHKEFLDSHLETFRDYQMIVGKTKDL